MNIDEVAKSSEVSMDAWRSRSDHPTGEDDAGDGLEVGEEGDVAPGAGGGCEELFDGGLLAITDLKQQPAAGDEGRVGLGDEAAVDFEAGGAGEEGGRGLEIADLGLEGGAV